MGIIFLLDSNNIYIKDDCMRIYNNITPNKKNKFIKSLILLSILFIFLLVCFIYTLNISMLPDSIILFYGENLNLKTIYGISVEEKYSSSPRPYFN